MYINTLYYTNLNVYAKFRIGRLFACLCTYVWMCVHVCVFVLNVRVCVRMMTQSPGVCLRCLLTVITRGKHSQGRQVLQRSGDVCVNLTEYTLTEALFLCYLIFSSVFFPHRSQRKQKTGLLLQGQHL